MSIEEWFVLCFFIILHLTAIIMMVIVEKKEMTLIKQIKQRRIKIENVVDDFFSGLNQRTIYSKNTDLPLPLGLWEKETYDIREEQEYHRKINDMMHNGTCFKYQILEDTLTVRYRVDPLDDFFGCRPYWNTIVLKRWDFSPFFQYMSMVKK